MAEVARRHAELLVMGWPGHGKLYRTLMGSVTDSVLRDCPCPVVLLPKEACQGAGAKGAELAAAQA